MGLSRSRQRLLDQLDENLRHTDPALARKLTAFARLAGDQPMPRHEQLRAGADWIRAALAATHPSPLPPDPRPGAGGSPMPPNPRPNCSGSPLPPGWARIRPA
jgi:hypothetical protein